MDSPVSCAAPGSQKLMRQRDPVKKIIVRG